MKMRSLTIGFLMGSLFFTTLTHAAVTEQIKLIVDGKVIQSDVPPQTINGRTMIPARALAEALGAKVEWDPANQAVIVTSQTRVTPTNDFSDLDRVESGDPPSTEVSYFDEIRAFIEKDKSYVFREAAYEDRIKFLSYDPKTYIFKAEAYYPSDGDIIQLDGQIYSDGIRLRWNESQISGKVNVVADMKYDPETKTLKGLMKRTFNDTTGNMAVIEFE